MLIYHVAHQNVKWRNLSQQKQGVNFLFSFSDILSTLEKKEEKHIFILVQHK